MRGRKASAWASVAAILVAAGAGCAAAPAAKPAGPWSAYPPSPALDSARAAHADAASDREQRLLLATWFVDGDPAIAQTCAVLPDGHVSTWRYVYDSSLSDVHKRDLTPEQLSRFKQDLVALPASQSPAEENLLIVSYRLGGQWVTRLYDRTDRPAPVSDLFALTAAPIDPPP